MCQNESLKKGGEMCGNGAVDNLVSGRGNEAAQDMGEVSGSGGVQDLVRGGRRQRSHANMRSGGDCGNGAFYGLVGVGVWQRSRARRRGKCAATGPNTTFYGGAATGPRGKEEEVCGNGAALDIVAGGMRQRGHERRGERCATMWLSMTRRFGDTATGPGKSKEGQRGGDGPYIKSMGKYAETESRIVGGKEGAAAGMYTTSAGGVTTGPRNNGEEMCGNGAIHDLVGGTMRQRGRARRGERCVASRPFTTWSGGRENGASQD